MEDGSLRDDLHEVYVMHATSGPSSIRGIASTGLDTKSGTGIFGDMTVYFADDIAKSSQYALATTDLADLVAGPTGAKPPEPPEPDWSRTAAGWMVERSWQLKKQSPTGENE